MEDKDLFGDNVEKDVILRDKYLEPPFSILDSKSGLWQHRKRAWKNLGIQSEVGREGVKTYAIPLKSYNKENMDTEYYGKEAQKLNTSIFDPVLCEILYSWFCKAGGSILDPFAGGSVRGIVANKLGFRYTGIDIRPEQIESNYEQGRAILGTNCPYWRCADSYTELDTFDRSFDFLFSCPPYADLEVYSDLPGDISNMDYKDFMFYYEEIIKKSAKLLRSGSYACFVVGEVRDKNGYYYGFVPDTIRAFERAGLRLYNEAILLNPIASASMRADKQFSAGKKLVKIHQNILIFKKP